MNSKSNGGDLYFGMHHRQDRHDGSRTGSVRIMYAREIEENDDQTALINEKTVEYVPDAK